MKKLITILLLSGLSLSFVACSDDDDKKDDTVCTADEVGHERFTCGKSILGLSAERYECTKQEDGSYKWVKDEFDKLCVDTSNGTDTNCSETKGCYKN